MAVTLAEPLQALLRSSPPSLFRSDHYDAARSQSLQQATLRIAREEKHHLRGRNASRYLPGLLTKNIERKRGIPQIEGKRYRQHPQNADSRRQLQRQFLR